MCYKSFLCLFSGITEDCQLPFEFNVPHDPSFDDMRDVVVIKGVVPGIPERWTNNEVIDVNSLSLRVLIKASRKKVLCAFIY